METIFDIDVSICKNLFFQMIIIINLKNDNSFLKFKKLLLFVCLQKIHKINTKKWNIFFSSVYIILVDIKGTVFFKLHHYVP